jgi:8-hydroxy-5-deazaflavin:NADPH oxidoreductase
VRLRLMANFGVLGTGSVGPTIAGKLVQLGHTVLMGARDAKNEKAMAWAAEAGERAHYGTFADAAQFGDVIVNATAGAGSLAALAAAGEDNLGGKVLIDVSNPLDFSRGFPPSLSVPSTDSLGEQIQRAFPHTLVVKALNTVNALVMVDPSRVPGRHNLFISGDDAAAKAAVVELLGSFGWPAADVIDLGGIAGARATENYLIMWVMLYGVLGTGDFNVQVVRA